MPKPMVLVTGANGEITGLAALSRFRSTEFSTFCPMLLVGNVSATAMFGTTLKPFTLSVVASPFVANAAVLAARM